MTAILSLQLIGTPEVRLGATLLHFQRRRSLALLAYLVLTAREHPREALATLLAGDADPQAARHILRVALAELRLLLGRHLHITRHSVAFAPAQPALLDLAAVQTALASGDTAAMQEALARADGELLAGLCLSQAPDFETWLARERERWFDQRLAALQSLLERYVRDGALEPAIAIARRLLSLAPWHEDAHRQLMRLLARAGQRTQALIQYQRCQAILASELGVAPLPATTALYERLRTSMPALPSNLAGASLPLLGRAAEQERLIGLLARPGSRLITVVGLGGIGKTALARQVAAHFLQPESLAESSLFPDGVFVIDLASLARARARGRQAPLIMEQIARAIGGALGIALRGSDDPIEKLSNELCSKTLLLVLDNMEDLMEERDLVSSLLQKAPGIKLLVTSRVRLQTVEEAVLELEGLELPTNVTDVEQAPASQLFLRAARRSAPNRAIADSDRRHIIRICEIVQGHPLALIAAARLLRTLPCATIAAELETSFHLLQDLGDELPDQQRSLRRILEWSARRLERDTQDALRRMAVFRGGFEREAAHQVAGATLLDLRALCDESLLHVDDTGCYHMHELVRRFAADQLNRTPGEAAQLKARHAAYCASLARHQAPLL